MAYISRGQRMALMSKVKEYDNSSSLVGHWLEKNTGTVTRRKTKIVSPIDDATFWIQKDVDKQGLLKKKVSDDIGYGIFTSVEFQQGDFILDYVGRLISQKEAMALADHTYIYFFQLGKLKYSLDASKNQRLGRFVNDAHSRSQDCNCLAKAMFIEGKPHILLFAKTFIAAGCELRYDYGGGSALPWRKINMSSHSKMIEIDDTASISSDEFVPPSVSSVSETSSRNIFTKPLKYTMDNQRLKGLDQDGGMTNVDDVMCETDNSLLSGSLPGDDVAKDGGIIQPFTVEINDLAKDEAVGGMTNVDDVMCETDNSLLSGSLPGDDVAKDSGIIQPFTVEINDLAKDEAVQSIVRNVVQNETGCVGDSSEAVVDILVDGYLDQNYFGDVINFNDVVLLVDESGQAVNLSDLVMLETQSSVVPNSCPHSDGYCDEDNSESLEYDVRRDDDNNDDDDDDDDDYYYVIIDSIDDEPESKVCQQPKPDGTEHTSVFVSVYKKSDSGGRTYDKTSCCYFCEKLIRQKMRRHLETVHKHEDEVEIIQQKRPHERDHMFTGLLHRGNFNYNVSILERGVGELIVSRRPTVPTKAEDYLPCIHCLAFMLSRDMYQHTKVCKFNATSGDLSNDNEVENKNILSKSRMLLFGALQQDYAAMSDAFRSEVFDCMHYDVYTRYVELDPLILKYGMSLYRRHGRSRHNDISQKMRSLAKLVLTSRKVDGADSTLTLHSLIAGATFDIVVKATEIICKPEISESGRPLLENPSFGVKIGHILVKIAEIKKGMGIRTNSQFMIKESDDFLALHKSDWTVNISSVAHATFKHRKYNNPEVLPLTSDLLRLKEYQEDMIRSLTSLLQKTSTYSTWRQLLEIVYSRVVIFNKRRGGETAKLLVSAFAQRPSWQANANDEIVGTLNPLEKKLLLRMDMVHLPGKGIGARRVPVLLTPDVVTAMTTLVASRSTCGIPSTNIYFFATPTENGFINGYQAMQNVSKAASLQRPDLIHSTKLRKYIATVSQIVGLNKGELKWLANHMGHEVNIHEAVYRLHDSTIELAKVSRLLMAVDSGRMKEFAGKSLDQIDLVDLPPDSDEDFASSTNRADDEQHGSSVVGTTTALLQSGSSSTLLSEMASFKPEQRPSGEARAKSSRNTYIKTTPVSVTASASFEPLQEPNSEAVSRDHSSTHPSSKARATNNRQSFKNNLKRMHLGNESSSDGDDESYRPPAKTSFDFSSDENEDKPAIKKRVASARTRWSAEELGILAKAFGGLDKPPCTEAIMKLCKNYPVFQKRKVAQIKSRAWHFITTGR